MPSAQIEETKEPHEPQLSPDDILLGVLEDVTQRLDELEIRVYARADNDPVHREEDEFIISDRRRKNTSVERRKEPVGQQRQVDPHVPTTRSHEPLPRDHEPEQRRSDSNGPGLYFDSRPNGLIKAMRVEGVAINVETLGNGVVKVVAVDQHQVRQLLRATQKRYSKHNKLYRVPSDE